MILLFIRPLKEKEKWKEDFLSFLCLFYESLGEEGWWGVYLSSNGVGWVAGLGGAGVEGKEGRRGREEGKGEGEGEGGVGEEGEVVEWEGRDFFSCYFVCFFFSFSSSFSYYPPPSPLFFFSFFFFFF